MEMEQMDHRQEQQAAVPDPCEQGVAAEGPSHAEQDPEDPQCDMQVIQLSSDPPVDDTRSGHPSSLHSMIWPR